MKLAGLVLSSRYHPVFDLSSPGASTTARMELRYKVRMAQQTHYHVLVVGAGNAALIPAQAALEQRAWVGILEKARKDIAS